MSIEKENYMGVLVVNHYTSEKPIVCFGAALPSPCITEVAVHRAGKDSVTGEVVALELIAKVRMTDLQFGKMIGQPNTHGAHMVTFLDVEGYTIDEVQTEDNIANKELKSRVETYVKSAGDSNFERFFTELKNFGSKLSSTRKLGVKDKQEIKKYAGILSTYVRSNVEFGYKEINESSSARVNELKASIHAIIRDAHRPRDKKMLECSTPAGEHPMLAPYGYMGVNVNSQGSSLLFDDVNSNSNHVSIDIHTAHKKESSALGNRSFMPDNLLVTLKLSLEQYARFVRADGAMVPCTLKYVLGKKSDSVEEVYSGNLDAVKSATKVSEMPSYQKYIQSVKVISDGVDANVFKGKAGSELYNQAVDEAQAAYQAFLVDGMDDRISGVGGIFDHHQREVQKFFEAETKMLPVETKKAIEVPLLGITSTIKMLKIK
jgi:uncharacterized protein YaaR (DUF327 family)